MGRTQTSRDLHWLTPEIEANQAYHRARVARLYAGDPPSDVIVIAGPSFGHSHGLAGTQEIDMLTRPESWLDDVLTDMAAEIAQKPSDYVDRVTFRPLVIELDALGVHYIDALFGANVYFHAGQVWSDPLPIDLADLTAPDLAAHRVYQQSLHLAHLAVQASKGRLLIANPVLSCPINIGINLFGERLLEALIARPDAARHALRIIAGVILACRHAFIGAIPAVQLRNIVATSRYAPEGLGQIDGCATQLVSALQYADFFASLDAEILAATPCGGMIHLCGAHAQHIPVWSRMELLRSVQLNDRAAEDLALYFRGLRSDQFLYVWPTETMTVERILEITRGQRLILQTPIERPIPVQS